jgi:16S rRNA processing protein RimM
MIKKDEIFPIGQIGKPHGVKGELSFSFTTDVFEREKCKFFILEREHILVPFFIQEYRFKGPNSGFIKFEDVDTEEDARELSNLTIYLQKRYLEEVKGNVTDIHFYEGFEVVDNEKGSLGKITGINNNTANMLFELAGRNLLIPVSEEYITSIDHKNRIIYMNLPEGLLDL